ncbi:hypothetical protein PENARI_c010G11501 [Penicillium arizonense]|uniref:RTA1 domain protein n=1 Tax=Penicillium arizonense TaxID=1835702 RepID=A0A1F5LGL5_PENAI|nr:hypothetical protein PENARI_c010G11501 [Penicillium arizonense]OGE52285.1 hypothetical protein PENARI_c010G11501 [Penicillium arizonense]
MAPTATTSPASATATSTASVTCISVAPGKNGYLPPESCDALLYYVPSFAAAILFCVLYGLTTIMHTIQAFIYKKPYAWVISMGSAWELVAFIFRALQTRHQNNENYATIYTIFFLLAPIWINAFLYMTLGRIIYFYLPQRKLAGISAQRYGIIFVTLDIIAFLVQLAGASLTSNTGTETKTVLLGLHIYMGGIGMQEFFILCFSGLAIQLHRIILHMERDGVLGLEKLQQGAFSWRWLFYSVYFALGMITIRIIFRIGQYAQGTSTKNPVLTHEEYEYVFDALPMLFGLIALNIFHPGRILQGPDSSFPKKSRTEKKELKAQKKAIKMEKKMEKKRLKQNARSPIELENEQFNEPLDERAYMPENVGSGRFYNV